MERKRVARGLTPSVDRQQYVVVRCEQAHVVSAIINAVGISCSERDGQEVSRLER